MEDDSMIQVFWIFLICLAFITCIFYLLGWVRNSITYTVVIVIGCVGILLTSSTGTLSSLIPTFPHFVFQPETPDFNIQSERSRVYSLRGFPSEACESLQSTIDGMQSMKPDMVSELFAGDYCQDLISWDNIADNGESNRQNKIDIIKEVNNKMNGGKFDWKMWNYASPKSWKMCAIRITKLMNEECNLQ